MWPSGYPSAKTMWSPTTGATVVVVGAIVVVVGAMVVVVVVSVDASSTSTSSTPSSASRQRRRRVLPLGEHIRHGAAADQRRHHEEHDADAAVRTTGGTKAWRSWSGSGGSQGCDMFATVLRTTTPESAHTPLVHSTCAHPTQRRAVAGAAADLARWRGRGVAAGPRRLRRQSAGRGQLDVPGAPRPRRRVRCASCAWHCPVASSR